MACTSNTAYFTVQTSEVLAGLLNGYPWASLPNSNVYWSYPINSNNREWSAISGDWLGSSLAGNIVNGITCRLYQPYGSAPNTAHIVWSIPLKIGGLIGGGYGSLSYGGGQMTTTNAVIMDGKAFTNIPNENNFECIDMTTGKILYTATGQITAGIHLPGNPYAQSFLATPGQTPVVLANSFGTSPTPYLFGTSGTTWNYYDPFTGTLMISISNCTAAGGIMGGYQLVDGTNLAYGTMGNQLFAWNMSKVIVSNFLTMMAGPSLVTGNWPTGIQWTRPLPTSIIAAAPSMFGISLFGISTDQSTIVLKTPNQYWGFSAKDGTSLWNLTLTYAVSQNQEICLYGANDFIIWNPVDSTFNCYSMLTGALLWTSPSFSSSPWATTWPLYFAETSDNNNFYAMFPDGTMAALSLTTGHIVWHNFVSVNSTEYTNNVVPYVTGMLMVNGNIYGYAGYSFGYQLNPIPRFAMMTCTNATTGDITWTLNGGVFPIAAADGYVLGVGFNDGNLYCIGKGQTTTTVTAPTVSISAGTTALIQGSVMDNSAAQPNAPAISDANMSVQMDYLHMQNSTLLNNPPDCIGVPVTLTAVDPNGNAINIGTVTSDTSGSFAYQWTPTTAGMYTIYATFTGSNSYYSSYAETHATVSTTPTVSPTPTPVSGLATTSSVMTYIIIAAIAIIIAIAIVGALILRKHP
jgi:hypothetical protein